MQSLSIWVLADETPISNACSSEVASISGGFPTGRVGMCTVLHADHFELLNQPEDHPINPSPWYAFQVRRLSGSPDSEIRVTLRYAYDGKHRYIPKISKDRVNWLPLKRSEYRIAADGSMTMTVPNGEYIWVAAQEIVDVQSYDQWFEKMLELWPSASLQVIGYSRAKRPIQALITNPTATNIALLIGRQHPPEVSGALAMRHFVERLASIRASACRNGASNACAFFRTHALLVVPLINPDGVQLGHWRNNLRSTDLNRDWLAFKQPETRAVKNVVDILEANGKRLTIALDFHSTQRNVLYTQTDKDVTRPPRFAARWYADTRELGAAGDFERAERELSELPTAKNYFFRRFGIPSITFELGDETGRAFVKTAAEGFATTMVSLIGESVVGSMATVPAACVDFYCFMSEANFASLLVLHEQGWLSDELAKEIASAQMLADADYRSGKWSPSSNYLDLEAALIERVGIEAANVHVGRSRQDLHGIVRRNLARRSLLEVIDKALLAHAVLVERAEDEMSTVIPAYTHGVPSQPTTWGHQLLAFSSALDRDIARYQDAWNRMNKSQLGVAAGNTSAYAINRHRLAYFLGFDGPVENAYDGNFLSTGDYKLEIANAVSQSALTLSQFVENIHSQQRAPIPWIYLDESQTSGSSIMPQKRNPRPLDRLRTLAGDVVGSAHVISILAHNIDSGMHDYRSVNSLLEVLDKASRMYEDYATLIENTHVNADLALADLQNGYSTTTELADVLFRRSDVPFRTAHEYASNVTNVARSRGIPLHELSDEEFEREYKATTGDLLSIDVDEIRESLNPIQFVAKRLGYGGPQETEMRRSVNFHRSVVNTKRQWLAATSAYLDERRHELYLNIQHLAGELDSVDTD